MTDNNISTSNLESSSGGNFFEEVENAVNGGIQDQEQPTEVTPPNYSGTEQVTHTQPSEGSSNNVDWEKRYKDSQREAQRMNVELKTLKPFVPVLNAMCLMLILILWFKDVLIKFLGKRNKKLKLLKGKLPERMRK